MKIVDPKSIWFTSDTHFGHTNIIKYCNRPFESANHMDSVLISNWNSLIGPEDTVFHLGDFAAGGKDNIEKYVTQLNGFIHLIKGNHDPKQNGQFAHWFEKVYDYLEIQVKDSGTESGYQNIVLSHYAMRAWNGSFRGSFMLYGHSHGTLPDDPDALSFDVGVDCHNFRPLSYAQVKQIMSRKNKNERK